jgi:hypothetical protein
LKYALRILTIKELEDRVLKISGITVKGVETRYAEAGFNVDTPSHLKEALKILDK